MAGTKPGPAPTRHLTAIRDGNPGKRPVKETTKLPPKKPTEPKWADVFPTGRAELVGLKGATRTRATNESRRRNGEAQRARSVARMAWQRWARVLHSQGMIAEVDAEVLQDAAVCWAELDRAIRDVARRGTWVEGERGAVKNPSVTAAAQLRTAFKNYVANLGLAPAARVGMVASWDPGGGGGDDDDPFD